MKQLDVVRAFLRTNVLFYTIVGGLSLSLFGTVWEYFLWRHDQPETHPIVTLNYLGRFVTHLISISPRTLKQQLVHGTPILCMAVGLLLLPLAFISGRIWGKLRARKPWGQSLGAA
jgi:hypothetical protein